MRTHFGTFRAASAITKQTAERFRLQTTNSTRQIRPVIFPISAFAPSAPREIGEFSSTFSGAIAPLRRAQPPLDLTHVFLGGHESSPATAAYTASRHGGKRHGHPQRLRRHRADVQDPEHAARGACLARKVEQAVAVVPVLRPACLDFGGDTVGERFR